MVGPTRNNFPVRQASTSNRSHFISIRSNYVIARNLNNYNEIAEKKGSSHVKNRFENLVFKKKVYCFLSSIILNFI